MIIGHKSNQRSAAREAFLDLLRDMGMDYDHRTASRIDGIIDKIVYSATEETLDAIKRKENGP